MYILGDISLKQQQLPDQQVDSDPWVVHLCENDSGLTFPSGWHLTPSHVWARILVQLTIYRRLLIGRDGHLDQSEAYDIS